MLATHYWERAGKGEGGPHQDAHSDDVLAGIAVTKVTKEWGEKHVAHNEGSLQEAPKTVANVSLRMAINVKPITCLVLYLCENTYIILCQQTTGIRMLRVSYTRKCMWREMWYPHHYDEDVKFHVTFLSFYVFYLGITPHRLSPALIWRVSSRLLLFVFFWLFFFLGRGGGLLTTSQLDETLMWTLLNWDSRFTELKSYICKQKSRALWPHTSPEEGSKA